APALGAERQPGPQARDSLFGRQGALLRARVRRSRGGGRLRFRRLPRAADDGAPARRARGDGHADAASPRRLAVRHRVRLQANPGTGEALTYPGVEFRTWPNATVRAMATKGQRAASRSRRAWPRC